MALICESPGGLFRKCGKPAVGVCKWCGKPYCFSHQSTAAGKESVCNSEACVAKAVFTNAACSAKRLAQAHNRDGLCGHPTCGARLPGASCRVCGAEYCTTHLSARLFRLIETTNKNGVDGKPVAKQTYKKVRFFVCDQCLGIVDRYGIVELPTELKV